MEDIDTLYWRPKNPYEDSLLTEDGQIRPYEQMKYNAYERGVSD